MMKFNFPEQRAVRTFRHAAVAGLDRHGAAPMWKMVPPLVLGSWHFPRSANLKNFRSRVDFIRMTRGPIHFVFFVCCPHCAVGVSPSLGFVVYPFCLRRSRLLCVSASLRPLRLNAFGCGEAALRLLALLPTTTPRLNIVLAICVPAPNDTFHECTVHDFEFQGRQFHGPVC